MTEAGKITYSRAARLRVALSELAAEIADSARGMVPTAAGSYGGEFAGSASQLTAMARELLTLAVACERLQGFSWEKIGGGLAISRQAAQERFGTAVNGLDDALITAWLLGDDPRTPGLPQGAASTAETAERLDRWVLRHLEETAPLAHEDGPAAERPVSASLDRMDVVDQHALVISAARLVSQRYVTAADLADPGLRDLHQALTKALEIGLARRRVELYERIRADGVPLPGLNRGVEVEDLLAGARARLAELET